MNKRQYNKMAGFCILSAIILLCLAEIIFRSVALGDKIFATANFGEQLVVIAFAAVIMVMTALDKDRICYFLYATWVSYFVLDQFFELPGYLSNMLNQMGTATEFKPMGVAVMFLYVVSMLGIIGLGVLLVKYMVESTVYTQLFNVFCVITLAAIMLPVLGDACHIWFQNGEMALWLSVFNNLQRAVMVIIFTSFAYDTAKAQQKKIQLS